MTKLAKFAGDLAKRLAAAAIALYRRYPARANSYILAGVIAVAGASGIVIDQTSVSMIIDVVLPILLLGEGTHHFVSPAKR
jgi:tetrahydromethanopterin S-methyltransferase subunit B